MIAETFLKHICLEQGLLIWIPKDTKVSFLQMFCYRGDVSFLVLVEVTKNRCFLRNAVFLNVLGMSLLRFLPLQKHESLF